MFVFVLFLFLILYFHINDLFHFDAAFHPGNNKYVADESFAPSSSLISGLSKGVSVSGVDQSDVAFRYLYTIFPLERLFVTETFYSVFLGRKQTA